jgi:hypothetical protein
MGKKCLGLNRRTAGITERRRAHTQGIRTHTKAAAAGTIKKYGHRLAIVPQFQQ